MSIELAQLFASLGGTGALAGVVYMELRKLRESFAILADKLTRLEERDRWRDEGTPHPRAATNE